jgi:hypothetical protein
MPDEKDINTENINYTTENYSSGDGEENSSEISNDEDIEINNEPPMELEEEFVKPKKSILLKILFGIIGLLVLLLLIGAILYFTGFFTPKETKEVTKTIDTEQVIPKQDTYNFDIKNINSKKLNEQLATLTNANLNSDKIDELERKANERKLIEEQKQKEDELLKQKEDELLQQKTELEDKKQELEKQKAELESMKQEAQLLKEELFKNSKEDIPQEIVNQTPIVEENNTEKIENLNNDSTKKENKSDFLLFINVAKIKGVLYKKYLDKATKINPNIKLCRDDKNRIEIYYGPFEKNEDRTELLNKLITNNFNEAYELELTQEEYDKRCNY